MEDLEKPRGLYDPPYEPMAEHKDLSGGVETRGILFGVEESSKDPTMVKFLKGWKKRL
jgi:hypothetical protein